MNDSGYIGKYRVEKRLGRGAMGEVMLAHDPGVDRLVAVKTLRMRFEDHDEVRERFAREARAAGAINHPSVVTIYELGEHDGAAFIAMEYLQGLDLQKRLKQAGPVPAAEALDIIDQVLDGLAYCHDAGVFHRDMKPANIIMSDDGRVKITDFGIARVQDSDLTATGTAPGTPNYMSPEQISGQTVDGRSDLFSVAIILYELLAGARPFDGDNAATTMYKIVHEAFEVPEDAAQRIPPSVLDVLHKALAKAPEDRFPSAQALRTALKSAAQQTAAPGASDTFADAPTTLHPSHGATAPRAGRRALVGTALALLLVGAAAGGWWWHTQQGGPPGTLSLITEPEGAEVLQDSTALGTTPLRVDLPSGTHRIVVRKAGFQAQDVSVEVLPGVTSDIWLPLDRVR